MIRIKSCIESTLYIICKVFFLQKPENSWILVLLLGCSDFVGKLEILWLLLKYIEFFSHPASMQGVKKRCVFSPYKREAITYRRKNCSLCQYRFGWNTGELRTGSSGWIHKRAEVLEFLTSRRSEQQTNRRTKIQRPLLCSPFFIKELIHSWQI